MTNQEIRAAVLESLGEVAPEADAAALDPVRPLQEQIELDSMDFLFYLTAVADRTGVEIPEADYAAVRSLDGCISYVAANCGARRTGS
jgi:acyl carrier protein